MEPCYGTPVTIFVLLLITKCRERAWIPTTDFCFRHESDLVKIDAQNLT